MEEFNPHSAENIAEELISAGLPRQLALLKASEEAKYAEFRETVNDLTAGLLEYAKKQVADKGFHYISHVVSSDCIYLSVGRTPEDKFPFNLTINVRCSLALTLKNIAYDLDKINV